MTEVGPRRGNATDVDENVENILGQQVMGDFRPSDLVDTAIAATGNALRRPAAVARAAAGFLGDLNYIVSGELSLQPEKKDRRFIDPEWTDSVVFRNLLQTYLALQKSLDRYAARSATDPREVERTKFLLSQVADALAPSNFLLFNPAALRRARETNGRSLVNGARNFIADLKARRPIPAQVDTSGFVVGENLACTPGSVVLRTEMFELIQYAPQTDRVYERPILIVPSIVNKFYVFDLAPERSVIEHFIKAGMTVFVMAWRNPQPRHDRWGMPEYQDAIDTAVESVLDISEIDSVNMWAVCGAGPVAVSVGGYYTATRQRKINSLMLFVSPLDTVAMSTAPGIGAFMDKDSPAAPDRVAEVVRTQRMSARDFTLLFAMLRANELIWHYWVDNYLMGNSPKPFDVLYWNQDGTGMTAQFNHDFSMFVRDNPLVTPGTMKVRGVPLPDLAEVDFDSYVLGAQRDHLCRWEAVYRSAQMLGPRSQFVLGNSGHIQTIVCPPSNPKASFSTNPDLSGDAEQWLANSERRQGSWWDHCAEWTAERAGQMRDAPTAEGNSKFPSLCPAPGTYVHERG